MRCHPLLLVHIVFILAFDANVVKNARFNLKALGLFIHQPGILGFLGLESRVAEDFLCRDELKLALGSLRDAQSVPLVR